MSFNGNLSRYSADSWDEVSDISANMSVATSDHFSQPSIIVCHHQRQSVQFPRYPYRTPLSPLHDFANLLGLGQRECSEFMLFLLPGDGILGYTLSRRVGQGSARLCLQPFQLVETLVPFVVRHQFGTAIVIGVRSFVQLTDKLLHPQYFVVCHYIFLNFPAKVQIN